MSSRTIQLLAYQYRDLHDPNYRGSENGKKFADFLLNDLGLPRDIIFNNDATKMKYAYPDLYYYRNPSPERKRRLLDQFLDKFHGLTIKDVYVVCVKQDAPHIGFTASVVFAMEVNAASDVGLRDIFVPQGFSRSRFHEEFKSAWEGVADERGNLPVALFLGDTSGRSCGDAVSISDRLFGSPVPVTLPSGRSVRTQRGFPYVSYVIHADADSVLPTEIQHCDFAMLMALPGFVEEKMESVREYREKLVEVQKELENELFAVAETKYHEAWKGFEKVQGLAPTTTAAVQRILQKYPGDSVFALVAKDNSQLIEFTVMAAIAATEQVRSNIQSFAQQKLQSSYNNLQQSLVDLSRSVRRASLATAWATGVLAFGSVMMLWIAFFYSPSTRTQLTGMPQEPIHVIAEPPRLGIPRKTAGLKILSELDRSAYPPAKEVVLTSAKDTDELVGEVPTPLATPGASPIEIAIVQADGSVVARNSLTTEIAVAIRFAVNKDLFVEGQQYFVQVSQSPVWTVKLPIRLAPN